MMWAMQPAVEARSGGQTLEYARADLPSADRRLDLGVLLLGIVQSAVALYLTAWVLQEAGRGHYETQNASAVQRVAYTLHSGVFTMPPWAVLSLIVTAGALAPPGRWRLRLYISYGIGVLALTLLQVILLAVLDTGPFSDRWVYTAGGAPVPSDWRVFYVDPIWYWQIPLMILIGNPVLILLAVRVVRTVGRRLG